MQWVRKSLGTNLSQIPVSHYSTSLTVQAISLGVLTEQGPGYQNVVFLCCCGLRGVSLSKQSVGQTWGGKLPGSNSLSNRMEYPERYLYRLKSLEVDCLRGAQAIWMLKTDKCTGSVICLRSYHIGVPAAAFGWGAFWTTPDERKTKNKYP